MLEKYQTIVRECFQGNTIMERSRQGAFEGFLNRDPQTQKDRMSMAEILAVYTDIVLRKGGMKALAEVNKEDEHMKFIVQLFTHLVDKDLFVEVYRSYLGKRLLNEKSQSIDYERMMISLIKMSCGPAFTKKLEGMLNDLSLAHEEAKNYDKLRQTPGHS